MVLKERIVFDVCCCEHQMFAHYLYEYRKGLRNLVLYTTSAPNRDAIEKRLKAEDISFYVQEVNQTKINIFFGDRRCIEVSSR